MLCKYGLVRGCCAFQIRSVWQFIFVQYSTYGWLVCWRARCDAWWIIGDEDGEVAWSWTMMLHRKRWVTMILATWFVTRCCKWKTVAGGWRGMNARKWVGASNFLSAAICTWFLPDHDDTTEFACQISWKSHIAESDACFWDVHARKRSQQCCQAIWFVLKPFHETSQILQSRCLPLSNAGLSAPAVERFIAMLPTPMVFGPRWRFNMFAKPVELWNIVWYHDVILRQKTNLARTLFFNWLLQPNTSLACVHVGPLKFLHTAPDVAWAWVAGWRMLDRPCHVQFQVSRGAF